jgi:hypothetical protein
MLEIKNLHVKPEYEDRAIMNGFARDVPLRLPIEFMFETQKLIGIRLEGGVG